MTGKNKKRRASINFSFFYNKIKENKILIVCLGVISFVAFLTGIIVAIKMGKHPNDDKYDLLKINFSFWGRLLSVLFVSLICFACSWKVFLLPIALLFLAYRGYLLGFDIVFVIICNGLTGIFAVLVILPCQIIICAVLIMMYAALSKINSKSCGWNKGKMIKQKVKCFSVAVICLIIICLIESLLFLLMSPNVIFIP